MCEQPTERYNEQAEAAKLLERLSPKREEISNAEFCRFVQEAREQRSRAEAAEHHLAGALLLVGQLKDALFDLAEFCECPGDHDDPDSMCKHHAKAYALAVPDDRARELGAAINQLLRVDFRARVGAVLKHTDARAVLDAVSEVRRVYRAARGQADGKVTG